MNERKPHWLKTKLPKGKEYLRIKEIVHKNKLHTICESGKCPNLSDCWSRGTATFMILGEICTRSCKFCATKTGKPLPIDINEPQGISQSVKMMNLKHCVITSKSGIMLGLGEKDNQVLETMDESSKKRLIFVKIKAFQNF